MWVETIQHHLTTQLQQLQQQQQFQQQTTTTTFSGFILWPLFACSAIMVGFSGATISFTAWNLVLPLLLKFFGLELFTALFISVALDLVNSIILTVFYGYYRKISFTSGFIFSLVSAPVALIVSLTTGTLLLRYQRFLEGGVGYFPFLLSAIFFIRGIVTVVRDIREKKAAAANQLNQMGGVNNSNGNRRNLERNIRTSAHHHLDQRELDEIDDDEEHYRVGDDDDDDASDLRAEMVGGDDDSSIPNNNGGENGSGHFASRRSSNHFGSQHEELDDFSGSSLSAKSNTNNRAKSPTNIQSPVRNDGSGSQQPQPQPQQQLTGNNNKLSMSEQQQVQNSTPPVMMTDDMSSHEIAISSNDDDYVLHRNNDNDGMNKTYLRPLGQPAWRYYLTQRFAVENGFGNDMVLSTDFSTKEKIVRTVITCIVMALVGGMSGLVYVGGGMIINVVLTACWKVDQKVATATGCFCTLLCMLVLALTFIGQTAIYSMTTLYFLIVGIPCCFVGAVVGAFLSLRISNVATFFTISAVLLVLGIVITVQGQL